jgi:hypothetical protein
MESTELNSYNILELYIIDDTFIFFIEHARDLHVIVLQIAKEKPVLLQTLRQSQQKGKQKKREKKETTKNGK